MTQILEYSLFQISLSRTELSLTKMSLQVLQVMKFKEFNGCHYLSFLNGHGEQPLLSTKTISCPTAPVVNGTELTFKVSRADDPILYKKVCELEDEVTTLLKNLPNEFAVQLPVSFQQALKNADHPRHLVRSNYYYTAQNNEPLMYLKGNVANLPIHNGKKEVSSSDLVAGNYRFKIRASVIYCGNHKNPAHMFNLQLRICDIKYNVPRLTKQKAMDADALTALFGTYSDDEEVCN